jgi:hypothetical protein
MRSSYRGKGLKQMINEKRLRELLIFAFESLQKQQDTISTLMTEIAALRDSLCELGRDRGYEEILNQHRAHHRNLAKPLADEATRVYDAIIHELSTVY